MFKDKISIIIPCYNDAEFIEKAVQSALNQTYPNKEIIVIDDGSDAKTKQVLKTLEPQIDCLITQENKGQSTARNRGIKAASGTLIMTLDSDDYFEPEFCKKAVAVLKDTAVRLVTCQALLHFETEPNRIFEPKGGKLTDFLFSSSALGSAMYAKADWKRINGYDENMRMGWEDWEFYIRLMQLGGRCEVIPEPLFHYRKRENTTTARANKNRGALWEYIMLKHKYLYLANYENLIHFFVTKIEQEEFEKNKNKRRIEFKIGECILRPIRFVKKILS